MKSLCDHPEIYKPFLIIVTLRSSSMKLIVKMKTDMKMKMVLTIGHIKSFLADATLNIICRKKGDDDKHKYKYFIQIMDFSV